MQAGENKVGCEGVDGLLRIHSEYEVCDVCRAESKEDRNSKIQELIWTAITHLTSDDATEEERMAGVDRLRELEKILASDSKNTWLLVR